MRNYFHILGGLLLAFLLFAKPADAQSIAGSSARLQSSIEISKSEIDKKIEIIAVKNVLAKYNSPYIDEAENYVEIAHKHDIDPYLVVSISGVESQFGNRMIKSTNNPFGWGVGRIPFKSWEDGIEVVSSSLKTKYIDKGAETVFDIGPRYAGGSTTWAPKVNMYMQKFEAEQARIEKILSLS